MIDCHTHSIFSHDGKETIPDMLNRAVSLGMEYLAITDHCDKDCLFSPYYSEYTPLDEFGKPFIPKERKIIRQIDLNAYFEEAYKQKELFKNKIEYAVGIECGFMKAASSIYSEILNKYPTDITINSVHLVNFADCYFKEFFQTKTKEEAYLEYLKAIKDSLDAPYHYDVVAHIGYVVRKAPYLNKNLNYSEFTDILDEILKTIISKNKALEINSHAENTGDFTLPNVDIIKRYKELGGELITFGSDAHKTERVADLYNEVTQRLSSIGFKYIFKYLDHKAIAHKI